MASVQSTIPPFHQGAFDVSEVVAVAGPAYPTDGLGSYSTTIGDAHWTALGLEAGTFEVLVEAIQVHSPNQTITNRVVLTALEGSHVYAVTENTGPIAVPMKGGFSFTGVLTGFTVQYRIQKYQS